MGLLVDGEWVSDPTFAPSSPDGKFHRKPSVFRNFITKDGSSPFPADPSRYHLYISLACPWAHRTLIMRNLKNLESSISLSIVDPNMGDQGWTFSEYPGSIPDFLYNSTHLYQIYQKSDPQANTRVTVPILWDKLTHSIVSNESSEIILMLNNCFDGEDYYPEELRGRIEEVNEWIYDKINNGVYKAGFATVQSAYEEAVSELFLALDRAEEILGRSRYIAGERFTLADIRLFTTLVRFDPVYVGHFKCNLKRIVDYPNIWGYTREIYQMPGIRETVDMVHIKNHYYISHTSINPTGIVPKGPMIDFSVPHDRERDYS